MIVVCVKWVDRRPDVDPGGHPAPPDDRFAGVSPADQAALEWALRCRDAWPSETVHVVTVGPSAAQRVLRDALAAGADSARRVEAAFDTSSRTVARLLAGESADATFVFCGDHSLDRGTGSVPAFLAADLNCAQALGLVGVTVGDRGMMGLRRVGGGWRDRLAIDSPAVLSVEGSTAMLRRAPLRAMLAPVTIDVVVPVSSFDPGTDATAGSPSRPFRPRPRVLASPVGATVLDRIKAMTSAGAAVTHGDPIALDPPAAADRILEALARWSYRP